MAIITKPIVVQGNPVSQESDYYQGSDFGSDFGSGPDNGSEPGCVDPALIDYQDPNAPSDSDSGSNCGSDFPGSNCQPDPGICFLPDSVEKKGMNFQNSMTNPQFFL